MIKHHQMIIKETFHTSKNYFKMTLGGLMKEGIIEQNAEGSKLNEGYRRNSEG